MVGYTITGLGRSSRNGELEPPIIKEDTGAASAIYYEREYDDAGNLIRLKETYEKYENDYVYEYDYNSAGQRISCRTYANYEGGYRNTLYEYDADGNLLSSKEYRLSDDAPDGYLAYERRYEYDSEGREVVNEYYGYLGAEALFVGRTEHEYTDDGRLSRVNSYDASGLSEYTIYEGTSVYELYVISNGQHILYERVEYTYS